MTNCTFCKIVADRAPSQKVYSDELVTAFRDINPVAPTHILIIPNKHIASMNDLTADDEELIGHMISMAPKVAAQESMDHCAHFPT